MRIEKTKEIRAVVKINVEEKKGRGSDMVGYN